VWGGLVAGPLLIVLALSGVVLVFRPAVITATSPFVAVQRLHDSLHAGGAGRAIVAVLGVVLVVEAVTGLWLYGPWGARRPASRAIHRALAAVSLVIVVAIGVSGVLLATGLAPVAWRDVVMRLHDGAFAGWPSRAVWALAGLAVPALAVTGLVLRAGRGS
jgi:uncharacterized iron-regulated membrane protein